MTMIAPSGASADYVFWAWDTGEVAKYQLDQTLCAIKKFLVLPKHNEVLDMAWAAMKGWYSML
jgi:hypothetical protein